MNYLNRSASKYVLVLALLGASLLLISACKNSAIETVDAGPTKREKQTLNETPLPPVEYDKETLFNRLPAADTGIDFENIIIENDFENILTYSYMYNGAGVAAGDINNDGLVDLFFTSNQGSNALFLNRGEMKFEDISAKAGIADSKGWHSGVNMVDINADGFLDIYVCRSGPGKDRSQRANLLYINDGNMGFEERAASYGLADTNHSTQASFFDYDHDGDLDAYVINHPVFFGFKSVREVLQIIKQPEIARANTDNLFENNGDGTFTRVTDRGGCKNLGYGLGLITADLNGDGWADIYVANDFSTPDFMYINQKDGTFRDELKQRTGHVSYFGMGCDLIDINSDLNPDIVELDMTAQDRVRSKTLMPSMNPQKFWALVDGLKHQYQYMFNSLQLNQGDGHFSEIGLLAGVAKTDWSWSVLGADFDQDGWEDLIVTNGFRRDSKDNDFIAKFRKAKSDAGGRQAMMDRGLMMEWVEKIPSQRIRNYLFQNSGELSFSNKSTEWGFHDGSFSSGAVYSDLDSDGDLDLVISNIDDPAFVYENRARQLHPENCFLRVQPVDENGVIAVNARVHVVAGGREQMKELTTCRGFQSGVEPVLHFGLGEVEQIQSVVVHWPSGQQTKITDVKSNQLLVVKPGQGSAVAAAAKKKKFFVPTAKQISLWHAENKHDEYEKEILLPHSQSNLGPAMAVGDVNGDGRVDLFMGGGRRQTAALLLQNEEGGFGASDTSAWQKFSNTENVDAQFFDADGDGDLDLYVVNGGGSEFAESDPLLNDLFFRNDDGRFEYDESALPEMPISTGTVEPIDYDGDGDLDLFVGGRLLPGKYPFAPSSYVLENKDGRFTKSATNEVGNLGLVNDAVATDFDGDGDNDLIVVGEWTSVIFLENEDGELQQKNVAGTEGLTGWWFSVTEMDVNADGRPDYLLGNLGKNNKFKSNSKSQLKVHCSDFDDNGTFDIVLATEVDGRVFPVRGKECSTQQMPFLEERFPTYHDFAMADLNEIVGEDKLGESLSLEVSEFSSCLLIQTDDGFEKVKLPRAAQIAPIRDAVSLDVNEDGNMDIIAVGNLFNTEVETIRYDAGMGMVLLGDGTGKFESVLSGDSGLMARLDSRRLEVVNTAAGQKLIIANNDARLTSFDFKIQPASAR